MASSASVREAGGIVLFFACEADSRPDAFEWQVVQTPTNRTVHANDFARIDQITLSNLLIVFLMIVAVTDQI